MLLSKIKPSFSKKTFSNITRRAISDKLDFFNDYEASESNKPQSSYKIERPKIDFSLESRPSFNVFLSPEQEQVSKSDNIVGLLGQGNYEQASDDFIDFISISKRTPSPQMINKLISEFLKYQLRPPFGYHKNVIQLLFDRGLGSSKVVCSDIIEFEIFRSLDELATKTDGFYKWDNFEDPFKHYIISILKYRSEAVVNNIIQTFLKQTPNNDRGKVYNSFIFCCTELSFNRKYLELAKGMFLEMLHNGFKPTSDTSHRLIMGFLGRPDPNNEQRKGLDEALLVYKASSVVSGGLLKNTYASLVAYLDGASEAKTSYYWTLIEIFNKMLHQGHKANLITYNLALKAYARLGSKATHLTPDQASNDAYDILEPEEEADTNEQWSWYLHQMSRIWRHMKAHDTSPDAYTLNSFLHMYSTLPYGNNEWAVSSLQIRFDSLVNQGAKPNCISMNYLVTFLGRQKELKSAEQWVTRLMDLGAQPDALVLSNLIHHHLRANDPTGALMWYERLVDGRLIEFNREVDPVTPDAMIYAIMVDVSSQLYDLQKMDHFWSLCCSCLASSRSNVLPIMLYQRVINSYAELIKKSSASWLKEASLKASDIMWRINMIRKKMILNPAIKLDISAYNVLLKANVSFMLCPEGRVNWAASYAKVRAIYDSLLSNSDVKPDQLTFSTILNGLADSMAQRQRISPDILQEVEKIRQDFPKYDFKPNGHITSILLKIAGNSAQILQLHSIFDQFIQSGNKSSSRNFHSNALPVYNTYLDYLGRLRQGGLDAVVSNMMRSKIVPDALTYRIWLKSLERNSYSVKSLWKVIEHIGTNQSVKIDSKFLEMVGSVFHKQAGSAEMTRAVMFLIKTHGVSSRLAYLPAQFYTSMIRLIFHGPLSDDPTWATKQWLDCLEKLPPTKSTEESLRNIIYFLKVVYCPSAQKWAGHEPLVERIRVLEKKN